MKGSRIVVQSEPRGNFTEGIVATGETFSPGIIVQRDASVALKGGRHTYKIYSPGTDGEQPVGGFWVVTEELMALQGKGIRSSTDFDTYAAGERVSLYAPEMGDDLNLLISNLAGTGDDHALNEKLIVDTGTGELIATTGSPETEVAQLMETITDPTADTLAWCQWSGH